MLVLFALLNDLCEEMITGGQLDEQLDVVWVRLYAFELITMGGSTWSRNFFKNIEYLSRIKI